MFDSSSTVAIHFLTVVLAYVLLTPRHIVRPVIWVLRLFTYQLSLILILPMYKVSE